MVDLAAVVAWALYFCLFATYAANWLVKEGILPGRPVLYWLMMTAALGLYVAFVGLRRGQRLSLLPLLRGMLPVLVAFGALVVISLLQASRPGAYWQGGTTQILLLALDFAVLIAAAFLITAPALRRSFHSVIDLAWLVLLASIAFDVYQPGTLSKQLARAAGFAEVANNGATVLVILCSVQLDYRRLRALDIVRLLLTAGGVLATLSRGGAILYLIMLSVYCLGTIFTSSQGGKIRLQARRVVSGCMVLVTILGLLVLSVLALREAPGMFGRYQAQQRLGMFLGKDIMTKMDHRQELIDDYIDLISQQPIWGHGTGFSMRFEQRPHNVYMDLWVNLGLPGLMAYLAALLATGMLFWRRDFRKGVVLVLLVVAAGMVDHTVIHDRAILMLWGACLALATLVSPRTVSPMKVSPGGESPMKEPTRALPDSRPAPPAA